MRNILSFVAGILCIPLLSYAQDKVRISFDLKGLANNDTIQLSWGANNKSVNPVIMGKKAEHNCVFEFPLTEPRLVLVSVKGFQGNYELLVSPSETIEIGGRIRKDDSGKKPEAYFGHMRVKGASKQEDYINALSTYQSHQDSIDKAVFDEYKDINQLMEKSKKYGDEQSIASMYQTKDGQSYIERVMSTYKERQDYLHATISRYNDSFMGPLLLIRLAGRLDKEYRSLYDEMSEAAKSSYYGREVKDEVYPPTLVGDAAPTLKLKTPEGKDELISLAQHGQTYLLIDFWASWCEPCRKEIPNLKKIYHKYHSKGLDIVSISVDRSSEEWIKALKELNMGWTNYMDVERQGITEFKVQYIPSIFVVDSQGKILAEKLRGAELETFIQGLFK